ncbi:MAG: NAD-dependent epimerase/dehydratase family protein [Actinomycetota bacterium]
MRVLVTGGAGFVGSNLVSNLMRAGHEVTVLDDLSAGAHPDWWRRRSGPRCIQARVEDGPAVRRAARGAEAVVHLAARPGVADSVARPDLDFDANVLGTFNAVDAARRAGVRAFVFASSGAVLAGATPPLREDMPPAPLSPYGASKLYGEGITAAAGVYGMVGISLRFANVYGPDSAHKKSVISLFIRQALARKPFIIYGNGRQTRDFLCVEDVCVAIVKALDAAKPGVYHLGTGVETSVNELAEKVARACGTELRIERKPPRPGDAVRSFVDLSSAQKQLRWTPKVKLEEGLAQTADWMRNLTA